MKQTINNTEDMAMSGRVTKRNDELSRSSSLNCIDGPQRVRFETSRNSNPFLLRSRSRSWKVHSLFTLSCTDSDHDLGKDIHPKNEYRYSNDQWSWSESVFQPVQWGQFLWHLAIRVGVHIRVGIRVYVLRCKEAITRTGKLYGIVVVCGDSLPLANEVAGR